MKPGEYSRLVQVGKQRELLAAIGREADVKPMSLRQLDKKIVARSRTPSLVPKDPKYKLSTKFFAKLRSLPSVHLNVKDSRSKIRRECYGFRDQATGERVYLRIDSDSIVEFRDSPSGYLIGVRFLLPNLKRLKKKEWKRVSDMITRKLSKQGIIVNLRHVKEYLASIRPRVKLARLLVEKRVGYLKHRERL